jgi:hypothetical protein
MRPCKCNKTEVCRLCWLYKYDARYKSLWDGVCRFLGEPTGERVKCATCRGNVELKVFTCTHPKQPTTTHQGCLRCPDQSPRV